MYEVLTAPRVITGGRTVPDGAVVIAEHAVGWAGPAASLPAAYAELPRTDYPGSTIMPGLIDSHVHLGFDGGPEPTTRMQRESDAQLLVLMLRSARELLGVGVTTARRLGGGGYRGVMWRAAIAAGLARGPRMIVSASPLTVTGGHCWFMGAEADTEDDLRRMVRTHHKHGVDLIKVTGRLAPGYEADVIVTSGDPCADITVLGKLQRVIARGRDYVPDSGRFDVSAPRHPVRVRGAERRSPDPRVDEAPAGLIHGAASAVDDVVELLPVHVDAREPGRPQIAELLGERDDVADVVLPASLLFGCAVLPPAGGFGVVEIAGSLPGGLHHGVFRPHWVVVEIPATRDKALEDLAEQTLLAFVGQVVHAHRGHHRVERRRDRLGPLAGQHVELPVPVPPSERPHVALARAHHLRREVGEDCRGTRMMSEDGPGRGARPRSQVE